MRLPIIVPALLLLTASCSPKLKVQSEPSNAQVFISSQSSKDKKPIGTTPFEISFSELYQKAGITQSSGEYMVVTVESKDAEPEKVLLPPTTFGTSAMNVNVRLSPKSDVKNAGAILQRMHNSQKFAQAGQFERAHVEVDKALEVDPFFVRALSLKGSIFFLQKNFDEASKWFEKALSVDASFEEAVKMLNRIKQERK